MNNINTGSKSTVFVGDGNQVDVKYENQGESLAGLAEAIKRSAELSTERIRDAIVDVDTIQAQLARSAPNTTVIKSAWSSIEPLSKIASLATSVMAVAEKLAPLLA